MAPLFSKVYLVQVSVRVRDREREKQGGRERERESRRERSERRQSAVQKIEPEMQSQRADSKYALQPYSQDSSDSVPVS